MKSPHHYLIISSFLGFGFAFQVEASTVTNNADSGSGSLRNALAAAVNSEVITFAPGLDGATITLTSGALSITGLQLTIDASALPNGISLSGNTTSRILSITGSSVVSLVNLDLIDGREAGANGGGVFAFQSQLNMSDCSIRNCFSNTDGGGLWGSGMSGSIRRCSFDGNQAGSFGGGIFMIGSMSVTLTDSQISGNKAAFGGGIFNLAASPQITNCTIQGNSGAGIRSESNSDPLLRNSIVWGNQAAEGTAAAMQLENLGGSNPNVANCLIQGASGSASFADGNAVTWGTGNLDGTSGSVAPEFVVPVNPAAAPTSLADLRLFTTSSAINAGDNASVTQPLDLAGRTRIQGINVDLGAFEGGYVSFSLLHPALSSTGDSNQNGRTNFLDYALGFDPTGTSNFSASPRMASTGGILTLTYSRRSNGVDIASAVETSPTLAAGSWQPIVQSVHYSLESVSSVAADREQVILTLTPLGAKRFYRQKLVR